MPTSVAVRRESRGQRRSLTSSLPTGLTLADFVRRAEAKGWRLTEIPSAPQPGGSLRGTERKTRYLIKEGCPWVVLPPLAEEDKVRLTPPVLRSLLARMKAAEDAAKARPR